MKKNFKCGYVAVLGRPNAGKSSLVNFLVGEEIAIVSHRQQTTRDQILGIKTGDGFQIVFVDTPGIHHSKNNLDRMMNKRVRSALAGADVTLYLFDGTKEIDEEELSYIQNLFEKSENVILVETKIDKIKSKCVKSDKLEKNKSKNCENLTIFENENCDEKNFEKSIKAQKTAKNRLFKEIEEKNCQFLREIDKEQFLQKVSTLSGENMDVLEKEIVNKLPENPPIFDEDEIIDKSVKFLIAEKIRGILLQEIDKEIPHGIAVVVTNFQETEGLTKIDAEIVCERQQHKGIIIGRGGANLKKIGEYARKYAENLLETKCVLKLFVKVDESWRDKNVGKYYNF